MSLEHLVVDELTDHGAPGVAASPTGAAPAWYAIRVAGERALAPGAGFEGFRITTATSCLGTLTELVGEVPDQTALLRVLRVLREQHLVLLDLSRLSSPAPAAAGHRQGGE